MKCLLVLSTLTSYKSLHYLLPAAARSLSRAESGANLWLLLAHINWVGKGFRNDTCMYAYNVSW